MYEKQVKTLKELIDKIQAQNESLSAEIQRLKHEKDQYLDKEDKFNTEIKQI